MAAGCLAKGRSSSPALNLEMQASLAVLLGADLCHLSAFIASGGNASDDPTRDRPIRGPVEPWPECWSSCWTAGRSC